MTSVEDFEHAGLFDPEVDRENGRLDLLRWLSDQGFSIEQMIEAHDRAGLAALAADRRMVPGPRLDSDAAASLAGLTPERFHLLSSAFGFVVDQTGTLSPGYTEAEVHAIARFGQLMAMFSEDEALGFARVVGTSLSRVSEAVVAMFLTDIESPHLVTDGNEFVLANKVLDAVGLLDQFVPMLDPVLRRHMLQTVERSRDATISSLERLQYRYAVGFVDLVGFTPISRELPAAELGSFVRRFEQRAHDAATAAGARLVKLIGDEIMFVAPSADSACRVATHLMTPFSVDSGTEVAPRGGVAYGNVLVRGGDYYGEIVNLASRLVDEASAHEVLVTEQLVEASDDFRFEPAGHRRLKGFTEPIGVASLRFDR